jgi:hypothetical protein
VRIWDDPNFQRLSDAEKVMTDYILFGPQTNRIGIYKMSPAVGVEHLKWSLRQFLQRFEKVCAVFGWQFDPVAHVIWIPSWWDYNPLTNNGNNLSGALTDLARVPSSPLIARFASHLVYVPEALHPYFTFVLERELKKTPIEQCEDGVTHTVRTQREERKEKGEEIREQGESAETSSAPSIPPVLIFPTVGPVATWALTEAQIAKWQGLYPALDVLGECRKAWDWCDTHPRKRKTAGGMPAFLSRWLMRQVDSGRTNPAATPPGRTAMLADATREFLKS